MDDIKSIVERIKSNFKNHSYHGYKIEKPYLYVYLSDDNYDTGDGINVIRMNLETGKIEESQGFIVAVQDWGVNLVKGWIE